MATSQQQDPRSGEVSERTPQLIPVVDLFAGPGGLGEGFAAVGRTQGRARFHVALSVENNPAAHQTLELRSFFRQFDFPDVPADYYRLIRGEISREELFSKYPRESEKARSEALLATLGGEDADLIDQCVRKAHGGAPCWVLLGGPPCQAYSLVGRSRNCGNADYRAEDDPRYSLYRTYLDIIARHWPPVFVMENVKGLLSARINDELLFTRILRQLSSPGAATDRADRHRYRIHLLTESASFGDPDFTPSALVVRAENHGVPQARHRVILLGIRDDIEVQPATLAPQEQVTAAQVMQDLPRIRSGLSREQDSPGRWLAAPREDTSFWGVEADVTGDGE
jgi:DNA (cytosine-5)-methyltransferase 1